MKQKLTTLFLILAFVSAETYSQTNSPVPTDKKYFIGSTLFVPYSWFLEPSPEYLQLNFGYRIDDRNTVTIEAITWKYPQPLGIPYGPDYEQEVHDFPGEVQAFGAGLTYQRFLWRGLYGQFHTTAFAQNFLDPDDDKIQSGFQLFNTFRVGYHIELFNQRVFVEPSICITWWPINTNLPGSFQIKEDQWNNFFVGEPGLHFGINF